MAEAIKPRGTPLILVNGKLRPDWKVQYPHKVPKNRGKKEPIPDRDPRWWTLNYGKTNVRRLERLQHETFDEALKRFLDEMPRKPLRFLAAIRAAELRRKQLDAVAKRKELARRKYQRRMGLA